MSEPTVEPEITEPEITESEQTLADRIETIRPHFKNKKVVAFLGQSGCGKTVVSALFRHALAKYFIPKSKGKWEAVPSSGYEYISSVLDDMKKGNFPDRTLEKEHPKLIIDIYHMLVTPTKTELVLRDMSGENYTNLLSTETPDFDQQMYDLLESPERNAHLIFAKMYVIMIDCSEKNSWDTDPAHVNPMITKLKILKQKIHQYDDDKKMDNPIAIVFTKADRLEGKDVNKSAEELMNEYPGLGSSLKVNHSGPVGYFKVGVKSRKEPKKEAENRVKDEEDAINKKFELKIHALKTSMTAAMEKARLTAEKTARGANKNEDEINAAIESAKNKVLEQYRPQLEEKPPQIEKKEKKLNPKWVVERPLSYTNSEYNKFILWILKNI